MTETALSAMSDRPQAGGYNYTHADDTRLAEIPAERETEVPPRRRYRNAAANRDSCRGGSHRTERKNRDNARAFSGYFATVYFLGHPAWAVAYVQQRCVSRSSRGFRGVVPSVFLARADVSLGCNRRCHRAAPDALSEHRERQSPNAEAPSLGLHDRSSYPRECDRSILGSPLALSGY